MEIIISTPENSSPRHAFGPFSQITQYRKKEKMPSFAQSDESLEKSNVEQKQSVGRYSTKRFQHTLFQRSSLLRSFLKPKFLKFILKHQIIQKFLNNLYQNAYIKRKDKNYITENYLSMHRGNDESIIFVIVEELDSSSTVLQPGSQFLMFWDLVGIIIIALSLWLCPFQVCFLQSDYVDDIRIFRYFVLIIAFHSGIDFLISLNRGFILKGEVLQIFKQMIYDRRKIFLNYFKYTFIEEILNLLIWSLFYFQYSVNQFVSIAQMLLIFKQLRKKITTQHEQFYLRGGLSQVLDLINVILSVYFVAHTMACFWYFIGNVSSTMFGHSWLLKYNLYDETLWIKYASSLYWATMTMVTVGYGDITAQNHYEIVASIVMMFISSCMFAYSMNSIGYILKVIYDNKQKYKKSLILINQHMSNNNIKKQLQSRIRNYLQYYYQEEKYDNQDDIDRLYDCLPQSLRMELTTDIQMSVIKQIKLLSQFSIKTQQLLSQSLVLQTYLPGDYVKIDSSLYYLNEGVAVVQEQKSNTDIKLLNSGSTFGEYNFFTGFQTKLQVRAKTLCQIYTISRQSILETLKYNQKDFERYHQIKDEMIFAQNFSTVNLRCNFCDRFTHLNLQCPNNLYKPDIEKIIKYQQQQPRDRNFKRKKQRSLNARINCQELQNCAKSLEEIDSQKYASFDLIDQKSENKKIVQVSSNNICDLQETSFHIVEVKQLDEFKNNQKINETTDIDTYFSYQIYRPQFNLENNIREYERAIKKYPPSYQIKLKQAGKYTINYQTKVSIIKMKQILESP